MQFNDIKLEDFIKKGIEELGFEEMTEIQEKAIPAIQEGKDIVGLSQTGSGKTFAFGIPGLEMIDTEMKAIQMLVMCPTRELAVQVAEELRKLTLHKEGLKIVPIFGGSSMDRQIQAIRKNAKIIVGTPGRIMDHIRRKTIRLHNLKIAILDEADEMLNMGFRNDMETILEFTNPCRQTVMFSATMPKAIMDITKTFMNEPVVIKSERQDNGQSFIEQKFIYCGRDHKMDSFCEIYKELNPTTTMVFCNTKRMTEKLNTFLVSNGLPAACLHGDKRQNERRRIMDDFKSGGEKILVATDVAARGIDVKNVDLVVNFDMPQNFEQYVHRIGRTARAGKEGVAFTIVNTKAQRKELDDLMKETKNDIKEWTGVFSKQGDSADEEEKPGRRRQAPKREGEKSRAGSRRDYGTRERHDDRRDRGDRNSRPRTSRPNKGVFSEEDKFTYVSSRRDFSLNSINAESGEENNFERRERKPRSEGSFERRPRRDGEFKRDGGFRSERRDGEFNRDRKPRDGEFKRERRDSDFKRDRKPREGGSFERRPRRDGEFNRDRKPRDGEFKRERRDSDFKRDRKPREGGSFERHPRRDGDFKKRDNGGFAKYGEIKRPKKKYDDED